MGAFIYLISIPTPKAINRKFKPRSTGDNECKTKKLKKLDPAQQDQNIGIINMAMRRWLQSNNGVNEVYVYTTYLKWDMNWGL